MNGKEKVTDWEDKKELNVAVLFLGLEGDCDGLPIDVASFGPPLFIPVSAKQRSNFSGSCKCGTEKIIKVQGYATQQPRLHPMLIFCHHSSPKNKGKEKSTKSRTTEFVHLKTKCAPTLLVTGMVSRKIKLMFSCSPLRIALSLAKVSFFVIPFFKLDSFHTVKPLLVQEL